MSDTSSIIGQLLQGLSLLGNAVTSAVKAILAFCGLDVPNYVITLATIILLILFLYKFGNAMNKIVLFALIFLLISSVAGLAMPLLGV